jgi:hypothetical protein
MDVIRCESFHKISFEPVTKLSSLKHMNVTEILESALDLSSAERAKIASVLIESLDSNQGLYDKQMVDEVEQRELEVEQGKSKYLSEEEFLSGIIRNKQ